MRRSVLFRAPRAAAGCALIDAAPVNHLNWRQADLSYYEKCLLRLQCTCVGMFATIQRPLQLVEKNQLL